MSVEPWAEIPPKYGYRLSYIMTSAPGTSLWWGGDPVKEKVGASTGARKMDSIYHMEFTVMIFVSNKVHLSLFYNSYIIMRPVFL